MKREHVVAAEVALGAWKTLPRVPEGDWVRRLLQVCPDTFEGRRNRALIGLLADSALRISEALRLRIEGSELRDPDGLCACGEGAKGRGQLLRGRNDLRRRTRPMTAFTNDASCDRITFAVLHYLNSQWAGRPLWRESPQNS